MAVIVGLDMPVHDWRRPVDALLRATCTAGSFATIGLSFLGPEAQPVMEVGDAIWRVVLRAGPEVPEEHASAVLRDRFWMFGSRLLVRFVDQWPMGKMSRRHGMTMHQGRQR